MKCSQLAQRLKGIKSQLSSEKNIKLKIARRVSLMGIFPGGHGSAGRVRGVGDPHSWPNLVSSHILTFSLLGWWGGMKGSWLERYSDQRTIDQIRLQREAWRGHIPGQVLKVKRENPNLVIELDWRVLLEIVWFYVPFRPAPTHFMAFISPVFGIHKRPLFFWAESPKEPPSAPLEIG